MAANACHPAPGRRLRVVNVTRFSGQQDGEQVHLFLRRHPASLLWNLRYVILLFLAYVLALLFFSDLLASMGGMLAALSLGLAVALALATLWIYAVWYYDVYIVTDRRLLDFARKPLIYERRDEAQLNKVQDIRVDYPNPLALLLDFGNVRVQTAGSRGSIVCSMVPRPRQVQARILRLAAAAQQRSSPVGAEPPEAEQMRQYLGLSPSPSPGPAPASAPAVAPAPPNAGSLRPLTLRGYVHALLRPHLELRAQDRVWRKHWWVLMRATAISGSLFNVGIILGLVMLWKLGLVPWLVVPAAMVLVGGIWNLWNLLDWQNDLYVLTDDRIIDIEKVPFISEDRREARLQQIQDVHYVMPRFVNRALDFGDVEVETAGRDGGFTFKSVPHPRDVQAEIFQRVEQARRAASLADRQRQESDVLGVLYRYHQAAQAPSETTPPSSGGG